MKSLLLLVAIVFSSPVWAQTPADKQRGRELYQKGVVAYNLGHYAEAADLYEQAYRVVQDPALLFNAAQAWRFAGEKDKALALYLSYLRNYGDTQGNRGEVQRYIDNLKAAIASEQEKEREKAAAIQQPGFVAAADERDAELRRREQVKPIYKKAWFWGAVGGSVGVVVLAVGLGVGLGVKPRSLEPTFGSIEAN